MRCSRSGAEISDPDLVGVFAVLRACRHVCGRWLSSAISPAGVVRSFSPGRGPTSTRTGSGLIARPRRTGSRKRSRSEKCPGSTIRSPSIGPESMRSSDGQARSSTRCSSSTKARRRESQSRRSGVHGRRRAPTPPFPASGSTICGARPLSRCSKPGSPRHTRCGSSATRRGVSSPGTRSRGAAYFALRPESSASGSRRHRNPTAR